MRDERLIDVRSLFNSRKGRPKKMIECTSLGREFLATYRSLRLKPLRARRADLERAVKDALYCQRLLAARHSPFSLFMELNQIVDDIRISSEAT